MSDILPQLPAFYLLYQSWFSLIAGVTPGKDYTQEETNKATYDTQPPTLSAQKKEEGDTIKR